MKVLSEQPIGSYWNGLADKLSLSLAFAVPSITVGETILKDKRAGDIYHSTLVGIAATYGIPDNEIPAVIESSLTLEEALKKLNIPDPENAISVAINRRMSRLEFPWLSGLVTEETEEIRKIQLKILDKLRIGIPCRDTFLTPIEEELEIFPEQMIGTRSSFEPTFFRPTGPIAVDFREGVVVRRDQIVSEALTALRKGDGRFLLHGIAATGKSVVARDIAYRLHLEGWEVRFLRSKTSFDLKGANDEIERFGKEYSRPLLIFEDAHIHPEKANEILRLFYRRAPCRLLVTSRHHEHKQFLLSDVKDYLLHLFSTKDNKRELLPFEPASDIIKLFCSRKGLAYSKELDNVLREKTKESLWILAFALEAIEEKGGEEITNADIAKRVEKNLRNLALIGGRSENPNYLYIQLVLAISILYRREIPTYQRFLCDSFRGEHPPSLIIGALNNLHRLGEIERSVINGHHYYGLPHSALADLYLECINYCDDFKHHLYENINAYLANYIHEGSPNWTDLGDFLLDNRANLLPYLNSETVAMHLIEQADYNASAFLDNVVFTNIHKAGEIVRAIDAFAAVKRFLEIPNCGAGDLFHTLREADKSKAREIALAIDTHTFASRFFEFTEAEGGEILNAIRESDESKAIEITHLFEPSSSALRILECEDFYAAYLLGSLMKSDKVKALEIVKYFEVSKLAERLLEHANEDAGYFLNTIKEVSIEKAEEITCAIDCSFAAARLISCEIHDAYFFLLYLKDTDEKKAKDILTMMYRAKDIKGTILDRLFIWPFMVSSEAVD
jgi:hypothetical protein